MSEMQKKKKHGLTDFVLEIKRVENFPDFEKWAHVIQYDIQGLYLKVSIVIFC